MHFYEIFINFCLISACIHQKLCSQLTTQLIRGSATASDAAVSASFLQLQAINCSTSGNYSSTDTYAANVNQFLAALPENAVSKNGGFFNGTVGLGPATVYGLAMCPADYSRADCGDCLAGAASSVDGLQSRCPGSTTVLAMFDRCLIRYSNINFFGTPEKGIVHALSGQTLTTSTPGLYGPLVAQSLKERSAEAMVSPQRFSASAGDPYTFVQCTWDLPADKCRECLDDLSDDASNVHAVKMDGQRKSFSCTVRYSNTSFMVVPFTAPSSGPPPQSVDQTGTSAPPSSASGLQRVAAVLGAVIAVLVVACLAAFLWYKNKYSRRQHKLNNTEGTGDIEGEATRAVEPTSVYTVRNQVFTYQQLADATREFSEEEKLGEGSFGIVYRGRLLDVDGKGIDVAIKKINMPDNGVEQVQVKKDFDNEIRVMSPLHHRNIISLMGWCEDNNNLFQVYELIKKGNLEDHLYIPTGAGAMDIDLHGGTVSGKALLLDWPKRNNILVGIATGLVYLHCECGKRVLHRDIKPSNVMLDGLYNAKLGDFGLVTQFSHNDTSHPTNNVRGTRGYVDPAYTDTGNSCEQNDIYSFGILLLEVVCCVRPTVTMDGGKIWNNLVERVRACHHKNAILDAADGRLRGDRYDDQLKRVLMIGLLCVQSNRSQRPHTRKVFDCLTNMEATLPFLSPENCTLPTVNEIGSAASTSYYGSTTSEDEYSTSCSLPTQHSRRDEDAGTAAFLTSQC